MRMLCSLAPRTCVCKSLQIPWSAATLARRTAKACVHRDAHFTNVKPWCWCAEASSQVGPQLPRYRRPSACARRAP